MPLFDNEANYNHGHSASCGLVMKLLKLVFYALCDVEIWSP